MNKRFLGKYQAARATGDVSVSVGVTIAGKINIWWDYQAMYDTNLSTVLRWVDEEMPLKTLEMAHTEEDREAVDAAMREALAEAASNGVSFGSRERAQRIMIFVEGKA